MNCYHQWIIKQVWCDAKLKNVRTTVTCQLCKNEIIIESKYPKKQHNTSK